MADSAALACSHGACQNVRWVYVIDLLRVTVVGFIFHASVISVTVTTTTGQSPQATRLSFFHQKCLCRGACGPHQVKKNKKQNLKYFLFLCLKSFFCPPKRTQALVTHFRFRSGENVLWVFHVNHADSVQYLLRCHRWYIRRRLQLPLPLWTDTEVMKTQSGPLRDTPAAKLSAHKQFWKFIFTQNGTPSSWERFTCWPPLTGLIHFPF